MDLNHLYSQHQLSLMRAADAACPHDRDEHFARAGVFAGRIGEYQLSSGAAAATGWLANAFGTGRTMARMNGGAV